MADAIQIGMRTVNNIGGFSSNLIAPIFVLAAIGVLLVFVIKKTIPISHFLYANARLKARENYMVSDKLLNELVDAGSIDEFRSLLKETSYTEEIERSTEDILSVHLALEKDFVSSLYELIGISPAKSRQMLNAYMAFFEVKILKLIYRSRFFSKELNEEFVYSIGDIDGILLKHLLETKTTADISVVMKSTAYATVFDKEYGDIEEFEVALEEFVINRFVSVLQKTKVYDKKSITDILDKRIDILNIIALLKFRMRNIDKSRQKRLLINNKTDLCLRFETLINSEDLGKFVDGFKGLPYYGPMKSAYDEYSKDDSIVHFETELYKFFKQYIISNEIAHTLGPYPLFSYIIKKEMELRNLFIISRGLDVGFSKEKIREMIV